MHDSKAEISKPHKRPQRLLALDILRGITIAGMLLVNNPGSWGHIFTPLEHAEWNGLTPTDLVFPFFMFIMGVSTYMSLRRYNCAFSWPVVWKVTRRGVLLFLIGMFIAWFGLFLRGVCGDATFWEAVLNFDHIRILGVIPRLAICYFVGSYIALFSRPKRLPWVIGVMLIVYAIILLCGYGWEFADRNVISVVDHQVLGPKHMYADTVGGLTLKFDPEGLLSTLPSIAHMLIGFVCGWLLMQVRDNQQRITKLFVIGTILTFAGFLLNYGMPINKKVWSPTFVLTTSGLAALFLALLIWIIDIRGHKRWCRFFEVFGINPLFLYVLGAILSIIIGAVKVPCSTWLNPDGVISIKGAIYEGVMLPIFGNDTVASLAFALCFVVVCWLIGLPLYKNKIYIKI